jgi:hypothetical protein
MPTKLAEESGMVSLVISLFFAINTAAIRLAVHTQFFGYFYTFRPPGTEILIIKEYSQLLA